MAYNDKLANRIREVLVHLPKVEEKIMFGGVVFMVNDKMCVTVGKDRIMCRIDPAIYDEAIRRKGTQTVQMRGQDYKGYIHINDDAIQTDEELAYWIQLALDYNKIAKTSRKK